MGRLNMHSWMIHFFFFWRGGGGGGLGAANRDFLVLLPLFPSTSQCVPRVVPEDVPNSTWVLFHIVCPKFNSLVYKLKRSNPGVQICFYFATRGPKRCFYWGHAQWSKKIADGPMNMAPLNLKKRSCEHTHELSCGHIMKCNNFSTKSRKLFTFHRVLTPTGYHKKQKRLKRGGDLLCLMMGGGGRGGHYQNKGPHTST
jgi:hypothetical protein